MPFDPILYPNVILFIDYDLLEFGDDHLSGWWDIAQSSWRYVREGRHGEGVFYFVFYAQRCITLWDTALYMGNGPSDMLAPDMDMILAIHHAKRLIEVETTINCQHI